MNRKKKKKRRRYDEDESDYSQESDDESDTDGFGRKKLRSIQSRLRETEEAMAKILEQLEEVAQAAPETLSPEELKKQYSAEKIRETELNLQELNRLNALRNRQQRQIEKTVDEVELDDEEIEEVMDEEKVDSEIKEEIESDPRVESPKSELRNRKANKKSEKVNDDLPDYSDIEDNLMINEELRSVDGSDHEEKLNDLVEIKEDLNESPDISKSQSNQSSSIEPDDPKPSKSTSKSKNKNPKKNVSQKLPVDEEPINSDTQQSNFTMSENRLFDFDGPQKQSKGQKSKQKGKGKKMEDYEAPNLLSFNEDNNSEKVEDYEAPNLLSFNKDNSGEKDENSSVNVSKEENVYFEDNGKSEALDELNIGNEDLQELNDNSSLQTATSITKEENEDEDLSSQLEKTSQKYTTDAKRPLRRAKRKKPFGEDQQPKIDQAKMEEQKQIVQELSSSSAQNQPNNEKVVEEILPKQSNGKNNKNKSNKRNGRNKKGGSKQNDSSDATDL